MDELAKQDDHDPRPHEIYGQYANVAIVAQLPDGRIVTQWGRAGVTINSDRPPYDLGDPFLPPLDHVTEIKWTDGFRLAYGMPEWAQQSTNPAELPERSRPALRRAHD